MNELNSLISHMPAWTTDARGNAVRRDEWLDLVVDEVLETYDPLSALAEAVASDSRKSYSKARILELIEEFRS